MKSRGIVRLQNHRSSIVYLTRDGGNGETRGSGPNHLLPAADGDRYEADECEYPLTETQDALWPNDARRP